MRDLDARRWLRARLRALVARFPRLTSPESQERAAAWLQGETLRVHADRATLDGLDTMTERHGYRSREDAAETALADGVNDAIDNTGGRHA